MDNEFARPNWGYAAREVAAWAAGEIVAGRRWTLSAETVGNRILAVLEGAGLSSAEAVDASAPAAWAAHWARDPTIRLSVVAERLEPRDAAEVAEQRERIARAVWHAADQDVSRSVLVVFAPTASVVHLRSLVTGAEPVTLGLKEANDLGLSAADAGLSDIRVSRVPDADVDQTLWLVAAPKDP